MARVVKGVAGVTALLVLCVSGFVSFGARAQRDLLTSVTSGPTREIVVIEASSCTYCQVFRRDVAPSYQASPRAQSVPLRYVDVGAPSVDKLALSSPLTVVPTVLILVDGREKGRIDGYAGPKIFFDLVREVLGPAE